MRANYQACIHRRCMVSNPEVPSPNGHGWTVDDGELKIKWIELLPAPDAVLALNNCKCKKSHCKTKACTCENNGLECTDFCECVGCENRERQAVQEENHTDSEDESDDDQETFI